MEGILIAIAVIAMLGGAIFYNPLRRKMSNIIGVGGSYMILIGIMLLVVSIVELFTRSESKSSTMETVISIIFMVLCLGYMVYVMLARCNTAAQRIWLPFAACLIGLGFCWRFLAALILHIPMESGKAQQVVFPAVLYDPSENEFRLQSNSGDHADYYCRATGQSVQFWEADLAEGLPSGWRVGA